VPRTSRLAALVVIVAACGPVAQRPRPQPKPPAPHVASTPSARSVLAAYLDLTFGGRHDRAYGYLSTDDRSHLSRGAYIDQESANDRVRNQMRALGPVTFHIAGVRERGDQASAMVTVRTGLGTDRLRFVLKREHERWNVVYAESWAQDQ
jgi:hypothetical protein